MPNRNQLQAGKKQLAETFAVCQTNGPLVTVVTAVFNGERHLTKCIESVLAQDHPNVEHIIIDGGSEDATVEILRKYTAQIAYWRSEPDRGIYDAWNKALSVARGEWICFVGSDDELLPNSISSYMGLAKGHPEAQFLSSRIRIVYPQGFEKIAGEPWTWPRFASFMCATHVGSMHRRSLFERMGNFDLSYRSAADYEFLLRAGDQLKAAFTPEVTAVMRAGGASATRQALREKARAKVESGGRGRAAATIELAIDEAQYLIRPVLYQLRAIVAPCKNDGAK